MVILRISSQKLRIFLFSEFWQKRSWKNHLIGSILVDQFSKYILSWKPAFEVGKILMNFETLEEK